MLLAEWLVTWSDPVRFVLNLGATVIWIYAIVDSVRTMRSIPQGLRRWWMVLVVALLSVVIAGVFVPAAAFYWFLSKRWKRDLLLEVAPLASSESAGAET